jgi:hypothetical protein
MCHSKTAHILITTIIVLVAIALAVAVSFWHQQLLAYIIFVSRIFDVMLPILAVGALFKYLLCGGCHHHHNNEPCNKQ